MSHSYNRKSIKPTIKFPQVYNNTLIHFILFYLFFWPVNQHFYDDSYPTTWLVEEIQNNPEMARFVVERFVDENGDGELTPGELYRKLLY